MELDGWPSTVMPLPAVTLTFDLLIQKPNQYVYRSRYICDLILVKLAPTVTKILYSPVFGSLPAVTFTFWPQNLISTNFVIKIGWNSLCWFLRYGVDKVIGLHRQTHLKWNASGTEGFRWQRHKNNSQLVKIHNQANWKIQKICLLKFAWIST